MSLFFQNYLGECSFVHSRTSLAEQELPFIFGFADEWSLALVSLALIGHDCQRYCIDRFIWVVVINPLSQSVRLDSEPELLEFQCCSSHDANPESLQRQRLALLSNLHPFQPEVLQIDN